MAKIAIISDPMLYFTLRTLLKQPINHIRNFHHIDNVLFPKKILFKDWLVFRIKSWKDILDYVRWSHLTISHLISQQPHLVSSHFVSSHSVAISFIPCLISSQSHLMTR